MTRDFSAHALTPAGAISRRSLLAGAAGAGALSLAACRNPSAGQDPTKFSYMTWGSAAEGAGVKAALAKFSADKGVEASALTVAYDEYPAKVNAMIASNSTPDAGYLNEGMAMQLGSSGKILSIADRPEFADWLPVAKHYWNETDAVGVIALEVVALFYASEATAAAGIEPPATMDQAWSWDSFITQTDKLTQDESGRSPSESGFDPKKVRQYGVAAPSDLPTLHGLFKSNGLDLFDDAGTECRINSAEAIEVIKALSDLIHVHRVAPTPAQASALGSGAALLLQSGRVATTMAGQWILIDLAEGKVPYGVGVLPTFGEPFVCVVGGANAVFADTPHRDLAFEWMDFLASPEQCDLYRRGLWMPMEQKYYTDEALIKTWVDEKVHTAGYRTAVLQPLVEHPAPYFSFKIKNFPKIESILGGGIGPILAEPTDVAAKLNALAAEVKPLLEGAYPDVRS